MGFRFSIADANWTAYLTHPTMPLPHIEERSEAARMLRNFLGSIENNFFSSSPDREEGFRRLVTQTRRALISQKMAEATLQRLRDFLADRPWFALVVPSCVNKALDAQLCSQEFLFFLISTSATGRGLILQLTEPPEGIFSLTNVFPAFNKAVANATAWPGILLWTPRGDAEFFSFGTNNFEKIRNLSTWLLSTLGRQSGIDLQQLQADYEKRQKPKGKRLQLIQLSDLHIGTKTAKRRLPRVLNLVTSLIRDTEKRARKVIFLTGDLVDTPNEQNIDELRFLLESLGNLGADVEIILGNHDVRVRGFMADRWQLALNLPVSSRVCWYEDCRVGVIAFNSVVSGKLARGLIGERQFIDLGNRLDAKKDLEQYLLIGALHHHPVPIYFKDSAGRYWNNPIGNRFKDLMKSVVQKTQLLEDSDSFLKFIEDRRVAAILHGHRHIPKISLTPKAKIPVFGCGSSTGKISRKDSDSYMAINVLFVDPEAFQVSGSLLCERIPGAGLVEDERHAVIYR